MLLEGQPAQDRTDEGAEELSNDVDENVGGVDRNAGGELNGGVEGVSDSLGNSDGGVQVAARAEGNIDAGEDRQAPSPVDEQPAAALALGLGQQVRGDDAAAEEQQHGCAEELRHENLAHGRDSRFYGCREQC